MSIPSIKDLEDRMSFSGDLTIWSVPPYHFKSLEETLLSLVPIEDIFTDDMDDDDGDDSL